MATHVVLSDSEIDRIAIHLKTQYKANASSLRQYRRALQYVRDHYHLTDRASAPQTSLTTDNR